MTGAVGILNVGAGDTKIVFDPNNEQDKIRAARIVKDMLRRGYSLLIQVPGVEGSEPVYRRALDFDEATCEYIIADFDPLIAKVNDEAEIKDANADNSNTVQTETAQGEAVPAPSNEQTRKSGARRGRRRIKATDTTGVAVPRTAGG